MKFVLTRKKHFSASGFLSELVSGNYKDEPFKIHSYFVKIKSGFTRAKHYHKNKKEWMTAVWGKILLKMRNIKTDEKRKYLLDSEAKSQKIIYIPTYWAHSVKALKGDAVLMAFSPKPEKKEDTFPTKSKNLKI